MIVLDRLAIVLSTREARRRGIRSGEALATFLVVGAILLAPLIVSQAALNDLGQALALGLFAIGFNIVFKYSGLLSFGHAAFFGFAAYLEAVLLRACPSTPVPLLVLAAAAASATLGFGLGHICVRRSGAYFSMMTLAVAAFFYTVAFKWQAVTGGTDGLSGFMPARLFLLPGWNLANPSIAQLYLFSAAFLIPSTLAAWALLELTPFGAAVQLVRQNEERATFLGYDAHGLKRGNYALAAFMAGVAGALWAIENGIVSTDSIDLTLSTNVIIMAFLGGVSWFWGPLVGSAVYIFGSDRLSAMTQHWQLWMGVAFIVVVLAFPSGIAGLVSVLFARAMGRRDD